MGIQVGVDGRRAGVEKPEFNYIIGLEEHKVYCSVTLVDSNSKLRIGLTHMQPDDAYNP